MIFKPYFQCNLFIRHSLNWFNHKHFPACESFKNSSGLIIACNTTGESIQCSVKCIDGMIFTPGFTPLDVYRCSKDTNYQWNGQPPTCSRKFALIWSECDICVSNQTKQWTQLNIGEWSISCAQKSLIQIIYVWFLRIRITSR